jgi:hypothetical protein
MAIDLQNILSGKRMRAAHECNQNFIQSVFAVRRDDVTVIQLVALPGTILLLRYKYPAGDRSGSRAAETNYPYTSPAGRGGNCCNGIMEKHSMALP